MKIETKVELVKYILLHQRYDFDMILYDLISHNRLNEEISKIDERTFSFKVDADDSGITANQFLVNLNNFTRCMRAYFYNIIPLHFCIEEIIEGSKTELTSLLNYRDARLCTFYEKREDDETMKLISKLIINNFIGNAKYVDSISILLEEIEVPLKKVSDYSLDESMKILNLLSDVVFCQRGRGPVMRLFESMDTRLMKYSDMDVTRRKKSIDDFKKKYIDSCVEDYDKMFKSYNSKKKYLKYFV